MRPDGSKAWATSTRSAPIDPARLEQPDDLHQLRARKPHGSGEPVPGASDGSSTSMSIVT